MHDYITLPIHLEAGKFYEFKTIIIDGKPQAIVLDISDLEEIQKNIINIRNEYQPVSEGLEENEVK